MELDDDRQETTVTTTDPDVPAVSVWDIIARRHRLIHQIKTHADQFAMANWYRRPGLDGPVGLSLDQIVEHHDENECGWTACLAGHGVLVMHAAGTDPVPTDPQVLTSFEIRDQIRLYFGFPTNDCFEAGASYWPPVMREVHDVVLDALSDASYDVAHAAAERAGAIAYLEHLNEVDRDRLLR